MLEKADKDLIGFFDNYMLELILILSLIKQIKIIKKN